MSRMVERDGCLRPSPVCGRHRRSDHIHFSVDNFQSTLALDISKNHQGGIDFGITIVFFFILVSVRLFSLFIGLILSELLDQESTLSSGVFRINQITLFILLRVNVTRQIQHITAWSFTFLGVQGPLGFPLNFP